MTGTLAQERWHPAPTGVTSRREYTPSTTAPRPATAAFAPRLAGWFDWRHAIELAAALGGAGDGAATGSPRSTPRADLPPLAAHAREIEQVRERLTRRVVEATADAAAPPGHASPASAGHPPTAAQPGAAADADVASHRQRLAACRQAMDTEVRRLRQRLREALSAAGAPRLARLAEVDAVLEQVIGARERAVLTASAERLTARFEGLRRAPDDAPETASLPAWPPFCQEMRALLLAELDLRLQPSRGLLAALRAGWPAAAVHG